MLRLWWIGLVLACGAAQPPAAGGGEGEVAAEREDPTPPRADDKLPARAPVDGLSGIVTTSEIEYVGRPGHAHQLVTTYVFPQRARWYLEVPGQTGGRQITYRRGEHLFLTPPNSGDSIPYEPRHVAYGLLQLELRRALFLWPHGFEWSGEGERREAEVAGAGRLVAELDGDGRPRKLSSRTADGTVFEAVTELDWRQEGRRTWPSALTLSVQGRPVWTERVLTVDTRARFVDSYFLPADRRGDPGSAVVRERVVEHTDLPTRVQKRVALEADTSPAAALARADELRTTEASRLTDWEVAGGAVLELDDDGRPAAVYVRLRPRPGAALPAGYEAEPQGAALRLPVSRGQDLARARRQLLAEVPAGERPGRAYVSWPAEGAGRMILPLLPEHEPE